MVAGVAAWLTGMSGCKTPQIVERTDPKVPAIELTRQGYDTLGRRWGESSTVKSEPRPIMLETGGPPPARAAEMAGFMLKAPLINLEKRVPANVILGEQYTAELTATALEDCAQVAIVDAIPKGASYVSSEPAGTRQSDAVEWKFDSLRKGDVKKMRLTLKAEAEGELNACSTMSAIPQACVTTMVGKPQLSIAKSGPETALLGANVPYKVVVANQGTATAREVTLSDLVPEGMSSASGSKELTYHLGDLAPGQAKEMQLTMKAEKPGQWRNRAAAVASNAPEVRSDVVTRVLQPGIHISKTGTREQIIGRQADYQIQVENIGDTTLHQVKVVDTAGSPMSFIKAEGGKIDGNTATWEMATLEPKEKFTLAAATTCQQVGEFSNGATVTTADGVQDKAMAMTQWKGVPAVLLEMVDDPDPVPVGTVTTYTIKITNQGTSDLHNVSAIAEYEEALVPVSSPQATISGQQAVFPTAPVLAPKAVLSYSATVKAIKAAETLNKVTIKCDEFKRPISKEESTTVY